jgi:hypothetical protein
MMVVVVVVVVMAVRYTVTILRPWVMGKRIKSRLGR